MQKAGKARNIVARSVAPAEALKVYVSFTIISCIISDNSIELIFNTVLLQYFKLRLATVFTSFCSVERFETQHCFTKTQILVHEAGHYAEKK